MVRPGISMFQRRLAWGPYSMVGWLAAKMPVLAIRRFLKPAGGFGKAQKAKPGPGSGGIIARQLGQEGNPGPSRLILIEKGDLG